MPIQMIQQKTLLLSMIFLVIALSNVDAQINPDIEKRGTPVTSSEALQGDWTCVFVNRMVATEAIPSDKHLHNMRITGDTVSYFELPCRYYGTKVLSQDTLDTKHPSFSDLKWLNDTLVTFTPSVNGYQFYVRDSFDQKIVDVLVRDTFHLASLYGKWYLQTQNCLENSGEAPWRVKYPVSMARMHKLDKSSVVSKNTIMVRVNGKPRKFKVVDCSILEGYIELESDGWHPSPFRVIYFNEFKTHDPCGNVIIYR